MITLILSFLIKMFCISRDDTGSLLAEELKTSVERSEIGVLVNPLSEVEPDKDVFLTALSKLSSSGYKIRVIHPFSTPNNMIGIKTLYGEAKKLIGSELSIEEQAEWLIIEKT